METTFELVPAYLSPAEKKRSARNRRRFMRRRAVLRWVIRTFRLYRHAGILAAMLAAIPLAIWSDLTK